MAGLVDLLESRRSLPEAGSLLPIPPKTGCAYSPVAHGRDPWTCQGCSSATAATPPSCGGCLIGTVYGVCKS